MTDITTVTQVAAISFGAIGFSVAAKLQYNLNKMKARLPQKALEQLV